MESILASGQDGQLIPELDPKVYKNQASYVVSRTQTTSSCPIPVASSSGSGVRTVKFNVVDGNFIDLSTLTFSFTINNRDTTGAAAVLRPLSAIPFCWFRRLVMKVNGAVVEDISELSRVEQQISMFLSTQKRKNLGDMGTGWATGSDEGIDFFARSIPNNASRRCTWRPMSCGFLQSGRFLPSMGGAAGGLSIEAELSDAADAVLNATGLSTNWDLTEMKLHVDSVTLTSEITNDFADLLLSGKSILLPYSQNSCSVQYLAGTTGEVQVTLAKQFSRLSTVFVSLAQDDPAAPSNDVAGAHTKTMNNFYLADDQAEDVESYIQVNNRRWPSFSTQGTKHHMNRLMHALGSYNSSHASCISETGYGNGVANNHSRQFLVGFDLETIPHRESTGMLVAGGGTVQISLKHTGTGGKAPSKAYIITNSDAVLELKDQSSIVYS